MSVDKLMQRIEALELALAEANYHPATSTSSSSHGSQRKMSSLIMSIGDNVQLSKWKLDPLDTVLSTLDFGISCKYKDLREVWYAFSMKQLHEKVIQYAECSGFAESRGAQFHSQLRRFSSSLEDQGLSEELVAAVVMISLSTAPFGRSLALQDAIHAYLLSEDTVDLIAKLKDKPVVIPVVDSSLEESPGCKRLQSSTSAEEWSTLFEAVLRNIGHNETTEVYIDDSRAQWESCVQGPKERICDFFYREEKLWRGLSEARAFHSLNSLSDYDRLCGIMPRVSADSRDAITQWMRKHSVTASDISFNDIRCRMIDWEKKSEHRYPWETPSPATERAHSAPVSMNRSKKHGHKDKAKPAWSRSSSCTEQETAQADPVASNALVPGTCPWCKRSTKTHTPESCWFRPKTSESSTTPGPSSKSRPHNLNGATENSLPPPQKARSNANHGNSAEKNPKDSGKVGATTAAAADGSKPVTRSTTGKLPLPIDRLGHPLQRQEGKEISDPPVFFLGDSVQDNSTMATSTSLRSPASLHKKFIRFEVSVPGHGKVGVIVDHASSLTLASETTIIRLGCIVDHSDSQFNKVTSFDGQSIGLVGSCLIPVRIGGRSALWRTYVAPDSVSLPTDCVLLGLTTMSAMGTTVTTPPSPRQPSLFFEALAVSVEARYEGLHQRSTSLPTNHSTPHSHQSSLSKAEDFLSWLDTASDDDMRCRASDALQNFTWRDTKVVFKDEDPMIYHKPYRLKPDLQQALEDKISGLVEAGVLEQVDYNPNSMHVSNCFVVPKQHGKFRMVTDLKRVNARLEDLDDGYNSDYVADVRTCLQQLPSVDDDEDVFYALLDCKDAYHNIPLAASSRKYFTIQYIDQSGALRYYQYRFLPQGFSHASQHWLYNLALLLRTGTGLADPSQVGIVWYMDDVLIRSSSRARCQRLLDYIRILLDLVSIDTNDKLVLPTTSLSAFGIMLDKGKWRVDDKSLSKLREAISCRPDNVADLRQKLGVINYCRSGYQSNAAEDSISALAAPFHTLITPGSTRRTKIRWNDELEAAWDRLVTAQSDGWLSLHRFDELLPPALCWCIITDASAVAACGSLWRVPRRLISYLSAGKLDTKSLMESGHCVGITSHKFTQVQSRWPAMDREAYGIYMALDHWGPLLRNSYYPSTTSSPHYIVVNDNTSALAQWSQQKINAVDTTRGRRWANWLSQLADVLDIDHIWGHLSGRHNSLADLFSRMVDGLYYGPDGSPTTFLLDFSNDDPDDPDEQVLQSGDSAISPMPVMVKELLPDIRRLQRDDSSTTYQGIPIKFLLQAGDHIANGCPLDTYHADTATTTTTVRNWFHCGAFSMADGILYRQYYSDEGPHLVVVAPTGGDFRHLLSNAVSATCQGALSFRSLVCYLSHGDAHFGSPTCLPHIRSFCWWPGMHKYIKDYIHHCPSCRVGRNRNRGSRPQPVTGCRIPDNRSLLHIAVDFADPPINAVSSSKSITLPGGGTVSAILVVCDLFTGFTQYYPVPDKSAQSCAYALFTQWCTFAGLPASITSDNSPFGSQLWAQLCSYAGVSPHLVDPYHPQSNGMCERRVQACKVAISHNSLVRWDLALPLVSATINSVPNPETGLSPFQLLFARRPYRPLDLVMHTLTATQDLYSEDQDADTQGLLDEANEAVKWFGSLSREVMTSTARHFDSIVERRLNESDRANAGPSPISYLCPGDRVQWSKPDGCMAFGYVIRDAGVSDLDGEPPHFSGRFQRGHSYLVRLDDTSIQKVHAQQLRVRQEDPNDLARPQLCVDLDYLSRLDIRPGDFCAAVIDDDTKSFIIGKFIDNTDEGQRVHVYDRAIGGKRFYPVWLSEDGRVAIVEASLSSDELKRKLLEMVKKNKNLLVNNHSKDAKIKALTAEVERSRDAEADDQGVDVVEVNDYKMKYTKMANDMQGSVRADCSLPVSRMKKALIAEIGDQVAAEQVIAGGPTVSGYEGRAQQIKRLRREVRALKMQLKVSQNEGSTGGGRDRARAIQVPPEGEPVVLMKGELSGAAGGMSRLAESRRKQLSELQRETVQLKGKVRELSEVHEAVKSRNRTLTERNQELKEQIAVLMEKSDGDDKVIDEMRVYLDRVGKGAWPAFIVVMNCGDCGLNLSAIGVVEGGLPQYCSACRTKRMHEDGCSSCSDSPVSTPRSTISVDIPSDVVCEDMKINPTASSPTGTVFSGWSVMANTMVGTGVLGLASAFAETGWLLGSTLMTLAVLFAGFTLHLLSILSMRRPVGSQISFYTIAAEIAPFCKVVVDSTIVVKCFGVAVSYLQVAGDMLSMLLIYWNDWREDGVTEFATRAGSIALVGFLMGPVCLTKALKHTAFTNVLALVSIAYCVVLSIVYVDFSGKDSIFIPPTASFFSVLAKLPTFIFAFTCHQNMFLCAEDLHDRTLSKLDMIALLSQLTALIIFIPAVIFPYGTYGYEAESNFLKNIDMDGNLAVQLGYAALAVGVMCSYTLQVRPLAKSLFILVTKGRYHDDSGVGAAVVSILCQVFSVGRTNRSRSSSMPASSRSGSIASSARRRDAARVVGKPRMTIGGWELTIPGPAAGELLGGREQGYPKHHYGEGNEYGHWSTANDVHPMLAYSQLGRWSLSNREYGGHYYHPEQTYTVAQNPRMPNLVASRSQLDRFRADTSLMFD
ncbi:hypothetical protein FOL47_000589 [Perkinsus chesapeaki]|uniref:Reverse transcriptase n=1 Tax=Perkinsus chesapeaki TaxID=330153 RepID=A0A7J6MLG0_PERCH|nr:hypothetical protein FOL47_000589 [Perkinsus chesapeaki]